MSEMSVKRIVAVKEKRREMNFQITLSCLSCAVPSFQLVTCDKLTLAAVATPLKGGAHFPLFLLTLQAMVKDPKHKEEAEARAHLKSLVDQSAIQLPEMVPQVKSLDTNFRRVRLTCTFSHFCQIRPSDCYHFATRAIVFIALIAYFL